MVNPPDGDETGDKTELSGLIPGQFRDPLKLGDCTIKLDADEHIVYLLYYEDSNYPVEVTHSLLPPDKLEIDSNLMQIFFDTILHTERSDIELEFLNNELLKVLPEPHGRYCQLEQLEPLADILSIYEETFNLALFPLITYYCSNYSPLDEVSEATYQILKYFLDIYPDSIKLFIRQLSICEHTFALLTVFQDLSAYEFTDTMLKKLYEGKPINTLAYFTIMTQAANLTLADEFIHILLDSDEFLELQQLNPDNQSLRP